MVPQITICTGLDALDNIVSAQLNAPIGPESLYCPRANRLGNICSEIMDHKEALSRPEEAEQGREEKYFISFHA